MSPGNWGVFQLLKEVTFRRILIFCSSLSNQDWSNVSWFLTENQKETVPCKSWTIKPKRKACFCHFLLYHLGRYLLVMTCFSARQWHIRSTIQDVNTSSWCQVLVNFSKLVLTVKQQVITVYEKNRINRRIRQIRVAIMC